MNKDILELCEILNQEGELQIVDGMPVKVMYFRDVFQVSVPTPARVTW